MIKGALYATVYNRASDVLMLIFISVSIQGTTSSSGLHSSHSTYMILVGCFAKSILLLTYTWLPDAMEGPTPVSALLHSATLVVAGISMFTYRSSGGTQCDQLYELSAIAGPLLLVSAALMDTDVKRVIAHSTCAMIAVCWSVVSVDNVHLLCMHAAYKACVFVVAGNVIVSSSQDVRSVCSSTELGPMTGCCLLYMLAIDGSTYGQIKHRDGDATSTAHIVSAELI